MKEGGIPEASFPRILRADGIIKTTCTTMKGAKTGKLEKIIGVFNDNNIPPHKWQQILGQDGAFTSIVQGNIPGPMERVSDQMKKKKK
jgi:hypothetical protein